MAIRLTMRRRVRGYVLVSVAIAATAAACGSSEESVFPGGDRDGGIAGDGGSTDGSIFQPVADGGHATGACKPRTCVEASVNCGPLGDGCGGLLQCGSCDVPGETCGGGGKHSVCGSSASTCKPKTCADIQSLPGEVLCGPQSDGCGGLITCGPADGGAECVPPQTCGGGGKPSVCGGTQGCVPKTPATACNDGGALCGQVADGCGGTIDCGGCAANQACGTGGVSKCGPANGGTCTPKSQATACSGKCGPAPDGCGGIYDCGGCTAPQSCGGGGTPSVCGGSSACVPKTAADCAAANVGCGPMADGCGGSVTCGPPGGCTPPQTCGGGGIASQCGGTSACVKKTCADYPANSCGPQADGCGGVLTNCGVGPGTSCPAGQVCGGGGTPGVCGGSTTTPDAGCTGLCNQQVTCPAGKTTSIKGVVRAPTPRRFLGNNAMPDPIPGVVVYVPNAPLENFTEKVTCSPCGAEVSGSPLVKTFTDVDGSFELKNVPVGQNIPLVIQLGRWRRKIIIPSVTACTTLTLSDLRPNTPKNGNGADGAGLEETRNLRFPRVQGEFGVPENNIPLHAYVTGGVDKMECVLRKVGIADSQFSAPNGTGRVRLYQGRSYEDQGGDMSTEVCHIDRPWWQGGDINYTCGAIAPGTNAIGDGANAHPGVDLYGSPTELNKYDLALFGCEGRPINRDAQHVQNMINYTNAGGRLFATHFHYKWLDNDGNGNTPAWSSTANWTNENQGGLSDTLTINVDTSVDKTRTFASWLNLVGALYSNNYPTNPPTIRVNEPRRDVNVINSPPSQVWAYHATNGTPDFVQHFTFNTPLPKPVNPDPQCGRVVFSDFHVIDASLKSPTFPSECNNDEMNAQERVIEYMLFDLASCISPDKPPPPPTCTPRTDCSFLGAGQHCGPVADGCGGTINCGTCTAPQVCGGGGPSTCGGTACTPRSCTQQGANCGPVADGCGGIQDCGPCAAPQTCGGGGVPSRCGNPSCIQTDCAKQGINCGPAGDGCGGTIASCGTCSVPETCGGGGSPGVCGNSTCVPKTTCPADTCGPIADGCGGVLQCGPCPAGQICGGGNPGVASKCGAGSCSPRTCARAGANCGAIGDGCGGQVDCGPCTVPGQSCGGGGTPSVCGGCTKLTCAGLGYECGPAGDGCGGQLDCGSCAAPDTCGGGGVTFKCGHPDIK